ncbi:MAG: hypothetical protein IJ711_02065 [Lachnospiraceae bacterium]|nr:hypothetical protein [Lachnospiraceae bacterium]
MKQTGADDCIVNEGAMTQSGCFRMPHKSHDDAAAMQGGQSRLSCAASAGRGTGS